MKQFFKKYTIELVFGLVFIGLSLRLNLQFLLGSNINTIIAGHDEYIAVKEVYSILHPISLKHFVMAVISGNALYYGRIMFYIDAIVAFLPFKIWGTTGMVLAIRMFHAICILSAFLILSKTFLETNRQRVLFFIGSFCLYFTMYFIMMPKPEPLQLLVLTLFLHQLKKSNWSFGKHFILLGIAYGLKFNVLLILPIVFLLPLIKSGKLNITNLVLPGFLSVFYFIIGVIIAIPCLILSPIKPIFLSTYLHETFGGTEKGYDSATLSFNDWMSSGLGGSYLGHWTLAYPFLVFVLVLIFINFKKSFKTQNFSSILFMVMGLIFALVIMFKTKRLWPHYLWTAYIFMLIGMIGSLPILVDTYIKKIQLIIVSLFVSSSLFFYCYRELPLYLGLDQRPEVQNNIRWSELAIQYINTKYKGSKIGTDGSFLYPFKDFVEVDLYHPFATTRPKEAETPYMWYVDAPQKIWDDSNKLVVFYKRLPPRMLKENPNVYVGRHQELNTLFIEKTMKEFDLDTTIGELHIYKRR